MNQWAFSDYVLDQYGADYAVIGVMNCGTSYINDGFDNIKLSTSLSTKISGEWKYTFKMCHYYSLCI
jgi:hypothetical protein